MISLRTAIQFLLSSTLFLLPVAHWKVFVFGVPLYSIELPVLGALALYTYGRARGILPLGGLPRLSRWIIAGGTLFFGGALLSFLANPLSLTGLGMLKTWFAIPILACWLWLRVDPDMRDTERAFASWLAGLVVAAGVSLGFFFSGELTYDGRLAAWFSSANSLALLLAPGVVLVTYFFRRTPPVIGREKIFLGAVLILLAGTIFLTHSYGAWAGIFVAIASMTIFMSDDNCFRRRIGAVLILIGISLTLVFFEMGNEKWQVLVEVSERSSLASRLMIWKASAKIIADHPFFGTGLGRFQEAYLEYQRFFPPYLEWAVPQPHNLFLAVWLQTGALGCLGFLVLLTGWWRALFCARKEDFSDKKTKDMVLLCLAILLLYLTIGLVDTPFFATGAATAFWFSLAFGIGISWKGR